MELVEKIAKSLAIIDQAIAEQKAIEMWSGFSGGHDSLCMTHLLSGHPSFAGAFHANTGIGVEGTREYVRGMCRDRGWPLREIKTDESYDRIVRRLGFPGAAYHHIMYNMLKDRCVAQLLRERKVGKSRLTRIALATGIRYDESRRRMGYPEVITRAGSLVWVNAIAHWTREDRDSYISIHELPRNAIADALGMSGECLCGAYAKPGELEHVRLVDPDVAARIDRLNAEIVPRHGWGWEQNPPRGHVTPREDMRAVLMKAPLCAACDLRHRHDEEHTGAGV